MGFAVLTPFIAALFAPLLVRLIGHRAGWLVAIVPALLFYRLCTHLENISQGGTHLELLPWIETLGINYAFMIDGLSLTFALLITGIGFFILIYAGGYLKGHKYQGRFLSFMLAFMGSMLGLVLADNLITLFVFWELTSITSFLLIGFDHHRMAARRAAIQALVITGLGGLIMLAGFLWLGQVGGSLEMSELLSKGGMIKSHGAYLPILFLILAGAFTKSAQVPFHAWLPNAMEAPTPVSAYLHSATMVKAGVYLVMRMFPILGGTEVWMWVLASFGGATLITGTLLAVRQKDMKLMLAYTTVASLGLLVMLVGVGTKGAIEGAVLYLVAHAMFKGSLFMMVGTIDHEAGTRDITKVGGLAKAMPLTMIAAAIAALSMCGLPPFFGFVAKEVIYHAVSHGGAFEWAVAVTAIVGNALMFGVAAAIALKPFFGTKQETPKSPHEGPVMLWLGPMTLAVGGLVSVFLLTATGTYLISPMTSAVLGETINLDLHLWAGFNLALLLSVITTVLGIVIYFMFDGLRNGLERLFTAIGWGPDKGFDQAINGVTAIAGLISYKLQTGALHHYMRATFFMVALALLLPLYYGKAWPKMPEFASLEIHEWGVFIILVLGLIQVVFSQKRLTAIIALGIQGFAVALIFMLFGAPDLSFTQFMVETLSVVILALILTRLNVDYKGRRSGASFLIDGSLSIACGIGFSLLLLSVTQSELNLYLSEFFTKYSATIAHGRNIVNVILVDFRALDTLGEISVVMIAGMAVLALIRLRHHPENPLTERSSNSNFSSGSGGLADLDVPQNGEVKS